MGTQLLRQDGCTSGFLCTHVYTFFLATAGQSPGSGVAGIPRVHRATQPRSILWPASLTLCADVCMHTRTVRWTGTTTHCIQRLNLSPALTLSPLQEACPGAQSHREGGTRCRWHWNEAVEVGRMWLALRGPNYSSVSGGRGWRKENEARCNVGHKGGILGGLGGQRVRWRQGLAGPPPGAANPEL